jgi:hypothetical protein
MARVNLIEGELADGVGSWFSAKDRMKTLEAGGSRCFTNTQADPRLQ